MVVFAAISALISLACMLAVAGDARRRPRPDKFAWVLAFAVFAVAAGAEVAGSTLGWTPALARLYYLTGAVLTVGYLALGELYLLAPRRIARVAPGAALFVTAFAAATVLDAPVDRARLDADGWDAIARGPALIALVSTINGLGTLVVVGGALFSAWRFWRLGIHRQRMVGCVLIAAGTLLVAAGGYLTRFGHEEWLYVGMAAGVTVIFAGYLATRRPDPARIAAAGVGETVIPDPIATVAGRSGPVRLAVLRGGGKGGDRSRDGAAVATTEAGDPAIAFLEQRFLPLDDAALAEACRIWSVESRPSDRFDRDEARRVWALRLRLSPTGQAALDAHGVAVQLQLAELYHEVLAPGVAVWSEERLATARGG